MEIYTYSEARQNFSKVLKVAQRDGKVFIKRRDGSLFSLIPEKHESSPLDVGSIHAPVGRDQLLESIREVRER